MRAFAVLSFVIGFDLVLPGPWTWQQLIGVGLIWAGIVARLELLDR